MENNKLPELSGACTVGSTYLRLTDNSRTLHLGSQNNGRTIIIKIWYPADDSRDPACVKERLWHELQNDPAVPAVMKLLCRRVTRITTNSNIQPACSKEISRPHILIYNHGLISFAAENTYLMEDLASNGFIVISIQHAAQLEELQSLQKSQSRSERKSQGVIQKEIRKAKGSERALLSRQYYEAASNSNKIVSERAQDIEYVLKNIDRILESIPAIDNCSPSTETVGVMGLSLGGAVATEFAKFDNRAKLVVNMDGTQPGRPVTTPYLMMYSEANDGCNELSLFAEQPGYIHYKTIEHTRHLNFHDISMIYPILRRLGITGRVDPLDAIRLRNNYMIDFVKSNHDGSLCQ